MDHLSRRGFVQGALGLSLVSAGGLVLQPRAQATPASGGLGGYEAFLEEEAKRVRAARGPAQPPQKLVATEDNILGPFYRPGAPFRAKVTPPLEPGIVLLVSGRVWGLDTKKPLAHAVLDVWQANARGRYDNDDPRNPPRDGVFVNRARLVTDENGSYEYETIHPAPYRIGPAEWRPSHIHYLVRARGYKQLITQLYFKGDRHNKTDRFIKPSLVIELRRQKTPAGSYEVGTFDIVLAPK